VLAGPEETITPYILGGAAVVFGFLLAVPRIVLNVQSDARRNRIRYALPDSLDLINMMVTGGMPLRMAVQRARKELHRTHPDIACELAIIDQQAETGSMDQALRQFAARVNVPDVTVLATMVRHAEQIGGNISTAFRDFADSIRRTRRQAAEERGGKGAVKLMFPTVLCLTPPIYMLLLGPAAIELRNFITKENRPGGVLSQTLDPNTSSAVGADPRGQPEGTAPPRR
jgi:tight adherence protein C